MKYKIFLLVLLLSIINYSTLSFGLFTSYIQPTLHDIETKFNDTFPQYKPAIAIVEDERHVYDYNRYKATYSYSYNITRERFNDSSGNSYLFDYDSEDKSFVLRNFEDELDTNLSDVFDEIPTDFDNSRVAFFRSFAYTTYHFALLTFTVPAVPKKVYGYEDAHNNKVKPLDSSDVNSDLLNSVYMIKFNDGFTVPKSFCMNTLATYDPIEFTSGKLDYLDKVGCKDKFIILNSQAIDTEYTTGRAFNIFKNIITNLKN